MAAQREDDRRSVQRLTLPILKRPSRREQEVLFNNGEKCKGGVRATTKIATAPIDMKLEVVVLGVSDVDRAKAFDENLGGRLDAADDSGDGFRVLQLTPHHSEASIIFGKGVTSATPGAADSLTLAVDDVDAARDDLIARGVDVSEVFHDAGCLPPRRGDDMRRTERSMR